MGPLYVIKDLRIYPNPFFFLLKIRYNAMNTIMTTAAMR